MAQDYVNKYDYSGYTTIFSQILRNKQYMLCMNIASQLQNSITPYFIEKALYRCKEILNIRPNVFLPKF